MDFESREKSLDSDASEVTFRGSDNSMHGRDMVMQIRLAMTPGFPSNRCQIGTLT